MPETYSATPVENGGWDARVRVFRSGRLVDSFAVVTERFVVLIDTMCNPESATTIFETLRPELVAGRTVLVVNTHGDWDHVWGNSVFLGPNAPHPAPVIAHRIAAERVSSPEADEFLQRFKRENPGRVDNAENCPPSVVFEGSLRIDGGDLALELIPTPGHTPDHVSVWIPAIRTLLAGDAAERPIPHIPDPMTLPTLRDSLTRMLQLGPVTVLYCHARGTTDASVIRENITYFDELERRCRDVLTREGFTEKLEATDVAALIGWPASDALGRHPDPEVDEYYRMNHESAIKAMITWLRNS